MSQVKRENLTKEDLGVTRADIMAILDKRREALKPGDKGKGKTRVRPNEVAGELQALGIKDSHIEKAIGDLDSYV